MTVVEFPCPTDVRGLPVTESAYVPNGPEPYWLVMAGRHIARVARDGRRIVTSHSTTAPLGHTVQVFSAVAEDARINVFHPRFR